MIKIERPFQIFITSETPVEENLNHCFWQMSSNLPSKTVFKKTRYSLNPTLLEMEEIRLQTKRLIALIIDSVLVSLSSQFLYIQLYTKIECTMDMTMIIASKDIRANKYYLESRKVCQESNKDI